MREKKRWICCFEYLVKTLFVFIIFVLTGMSLFWHCKVDIYDTVYNMPRYIESHSPSVYILGATVISVFMLLVCHFINKLISKSQNQWRMVNTWLIVCTVLVGVASCFWIVFNDCVPMNDQLIVFEEAQRITGYLEGPFDTSYFERFPRNKGILLVMVAMIRIVGNSQMGFRIVNVIGAMLLFLCICLTVKKVWKDPVITILTILLLTCYCPIVIYTSFLYGTILSAGFSALSVYMAISFCEDQKVIELIFSAISIIIAIQMHQSAAVTMIAIVFYLLIHIRKEIALKVAFYIVILFMTFVCVGKAVDFTYEKMTGVKLGESVPASAVIYMGITAETEHDGPGAQNGVLADFCDGEEANKRAIRLILDVCEEYIRGERNLGFFVEKIKYQWLDPTMGSRKVIDTNDTEVPNSEAYLAFFHSGLRDTAFKLSMIMMIVYYSFNLFTGVKLFREKQTSELHFFIQILMVGGFTFQLMWESLPRYCFPYYVWLIPEAVFGIVSLYKIIYGKLVKNKR